MVTSISLGNLVTVNGKTQSVGSASGLDVKSIVDSLVAVKQLDETKITDKITANTGKLDAISQYRTMLASLQTAAGFLENPSGVSNDAKNVFQYRQISASTTNGAAPGNYITASTSAGATLGSYNMQINNLANAQNATSISFSSESSPLATSTGAGGTPKAGSFSFNGQVITISVGDTLDNIAAAINSTTTNSKVHADIIKVSDTDFRLKISATSTGVDNGYTVRGDSTVFDSMFTGGVSTATAAHDASVTLDNNLTITRPTNSINDIINGVTFTLVQATPPGQSVNVDVIADPTSVESKINDFVTAYNNIKTFIAKQQERDTTGAFVKTAILGNDGILNKFVDSTAAELSRAIANIPGGIQSLSDIGITFTDSAGDESTPAVSNLLQLDTAKLETQLDGNFDGVRQLFEFQLSSDAPDRIRAFSNTNDISVNNFSVHVDLNLPPSTQTPPPPASQVTLTYTDSNNASHTVNATATFGAQKAATSNAISNGIFGATTSTGAFTTGLTDGDGISITLNNVDGTTSTSNFVYMASPVAGNEFNSLSSLSAAISTMAGVTTTIDSSGKLNITPSGQFNTLSFANLTATDVKSGLGFVNTKLPTGTITGPAGSALAGLTMIYAPKNTTDSINVTLSQGVGARMSNMLDSYLTANTGFLDLDVANINTDQTKLNTQSDDEKQKISDYQTQLYNQYSLLDQAVSKVNTLLQLLDAQDKARQQASQ